MDRKDYKKKPQHLVIDARSGEIKRIVHSSDTDIGSPLINADLRVFGNISITGAITAGAAAAEPSQKITHRSPAPFSRALSLPLRRSASQGRSPSLLVERLTSRLAPTSR
jgi:hypothetical protein